MLPLLLHTYSQSWNSEYKPNGTTSIKLISVFNAMDQESSVSIALMFGFDPCNEFNLIGFEG